MRILLASILLMAAALTANAQGFVQRVDAPQLTIGGVGWTTPPTNNNTKTPRSKVTTAVESIHPSYRANESPRLLDWRSIPLDAVSYIPLPSPPENVSKRKTGSVNFSFDIKNNGSKGVAAIDWTIGFVDKSQAVEYQHLSFHSKVETAEGKPGVYSKIPFDQNWKRLQMDLQKRNALVVITITSIEYADGSRWQRQ